MSSSLRATAQNRTGDHEKVSDRIHQNFCEWVIVLGVPLGLRREGGLVLIQPPSATCDRIMRMMVWSGIISRVDHCRSPRRRAGTRCLGRPNPTHTNGIISSFGTTRTKFKSTEFRQRPRETVQIGQSARGPDADQSGVMPIKGGRDRSTRARCWSVSSSSGHSV